MKKNKEDKAIIDNITKGVKDAKKIGKLKTRSAQNLLHEL